MRGVYAQDVFEKFKVHVRSGSKSLYDEFQEIDKNKSGKVSSVEFRNVIKRLKLGLSPIEVNQLLDFANVLPDGSVDWRSFTSRILLK